MDDLIRRIRARVADPIRALDSAAWVSPMPTMAPPVTMVDVAAAEESLGFPIPPLLRRLYTEVGNGNWGPAYGLYGIPAATDGPDPHGNDMVGMYLSCVAPEHALEDPTVKWPRGLVTLLELGCVSSEVCDFLQPPYPVFLLNGDAWEPNQPVAECLTPVAASLEERLEAWLSAPQS